MRLTAHEIAAIKAAAALAFGPGAVVRLFGSRVDDAKRGGDIDLHIELDADIDVWRAQMRFEDAIAARLEPQKIDLIVRKVNAPIAGIDMIAHRDGIRL